MTVPQGEENRVIVDTNVIVSAFISPNGKPAKILHMVKNSQLQICYNDKILAEYRDVLTRRHFKFINEERQEFFEHLERLGLFCQPLASTFPMPDETDRPFYDVAKHCNADLITGNTKHYPPESFIHTPTEFLAAIGMLQQKGEPT
ncbi:MAG: putative toxin-antitoxin system toxin component, PIN family [Turicibacter sp.]|nr:putative toxin-antitoxin system toxin component, PIN family [Turicibacter sp.]